MLPSPSSAYQPDLMPRMSDFVSPMYWGAIKVGCSGAQRVIDKAGLTVGEFAAQASVTKLNRCCKHCACRRHGYCQLGERRLRQVSILRAAFQTSAACPVRHMATRILGTIGVALDLTLYLATMFVLPLFFSATDGTQFDGRSLCQRARDEFWSRRSEAPAPKPPSSLLGLFFPAGSNFAAVIIRFKMETPTKRDKYTAKRISEITDRIAALRVRWLHHVETQLASQQSRPVLEHYKLST